MHVRGFSKRQTRLPERIRGTYEALTTDTAINHLLKLGVTAVELMPVHHHSYDRHLVDRGLANYWGYNTLSFFAPNMRYAAARHPPDVVREFKRMVRALHAAGLEVILDVVYNHTAEGNHLGPTLSLRGVDNRNYYRLLAENPRYYLDFTGCGNTLNMQSPQVLQLIMDSLRYWVLEMHVDGFRFDLASALARELHAVDKLGAFFDIIHQDPVLSQVKLIAEPWDLGEGGCQVGNFPVGWTEWNGRYRDCVRRFWRGDGGQLSEFATRLAGGSDLYEHSGRRPYASINFVRCLGVRLAGDAIDERDERGEPLSDDTLLVLMNAQEASVPFTLPATPPERVVGRGARYLSPLARAATRDGRGTVRVTGAIAGGAADAAAEAGNGEQRRERRVSSVRILCTCRRSASHTKLRTVRN
jgi:glycogen operon protein